MQICFFHGLDSSPQGTKSTLLRKHYPRCWIPPLPRDVDERIGILERAIHEPFLIVGSSLGGLTAVIYAMKHPAMVMGMVLLAPAVGVHDGSILTQEQMGKLSGLHIPEGIPTVVIAGIRDEVIPLQAVRDLVRRSPAQERIELHEVDDDHNLHGSLDLMLKAIEEVKGEIEKRPR